MEQFRVFLSCLIIILFGLSSCQKDDFLEKVEEEKKEPIETQGIINEEDLQAEGTIEETPEGYTVDGTLTIKTDSLDVVFNNANLEVQFNDDGTLRSVSGESEVPPSPFFQIENVEDPIRADVNFYSGRYINEHFNLEIPLVEDITYFIFSLELNVKVNLLVDGEQISLEPPLGGHISFISDHTDPMFFWSVGADIKGSLAFGRSFLGQLPFSPTISNDHVLEFDAKSVKGGKFKFGPILTVEGMLYENKIIGANIDWENLEASHLGLGYYSGLNGAMRMGIPGFKFQIAEGSYAVLTEASSQGDIQAKAYFNGNLDPDLSWWPKLIPVKPDGRLSVDGFATSQGDFDFGISGTFEIQTPNLTEKVEGVMRAADKISFVDGEPFTEKRYTMEGRVSKNEEVWEAKATFTNDSTLYLASPPDGFMNGVSSIVNQQIDSAFSEHVQALEDLKKATENYELELSLRGLRKEIPLIVEEAFDIIDQSVAAAIREGRRQADAYLDRYDRKRCDDNIDVVVKNIVRPYKDTLTRLKNAVIETNDTESTRIELEAALRQLILLKRIEKTVQAEVKSDWDFAKCLFPRKDSRPVSIKQTVIPAKYVDLLTQAADNVKYIGEASNIKIEAQRIVDELPSMEDLEYLKNNIESCVSDIVDKVGDVGFVKDHKTGEYTYFVMINGERMEVSGFNVFDKHAVIEVSRSQFNPCNFN